MTALPAASAFTGAGVTEGAFKTAITEMRAFIAEMLGTAGGGESNVPLVLTINSAQAALRVTQTGAGDVVLFEDSANPDSTPWVIKNDGVVVAGYTAAVDTGAGATVRSQYHGTSQANAGMALTNWASNTGSPIINFSKARGAVIGTPSVLTTGDDLGVFHFYGYAGATGGWVRGAGIEVVNTGTVSDAATGIGAYISFNTRASGGAVTERLRIGDAGALFINDTSNANGAICLTINQGGNDDQILAGKSSDVATGLTTAAALFGNTETDDYMAIKKTSATLGGVTLGSFAENGALTNALQFVSYGGQASTTKSTAGRSLIEVYASQHDGANALADIAADGNVFGVRGRVGAADVALLIVDEDGDTWQNGSETSVGSSQILSATGIPAGGTAGAGYKFSSTANLGVFFGSGAPTLSAAQGSIYIRTDGSSTSTRCYVNTNGTTGWTNFTTAT